MSDRPTDLHTLRGLLVPERPDIAARIRDLEGQFCVVLNDKLRAESMARQCADELLRVQGAIQELRRLLPDQSGLPLAGVGGDSNARQG